MLCFFRGTVAAGATRWTERTRSNDMHGYAAARSTYTTRGASRGIDTMLRQARKWSYVIHGRQFVLWCYVRHGHEQIAVHSTTCAKSHRCVPEKHRPPWFYRKVGFDIYPGHSGFYKCRNNRFTLICSVAEARQLLLWRRNERRMYVTWGLTIGVRYCFSGMFFN